ncbi:MAG: DNA/RNA nuclease SfsA [Gammaproteobacteria bacterium]|nr:MAG: DNA/RNA nuclease SfsA [Gammaproteobacteria bacterium]
MEFAPPLVRGTLVRRYKRFLADVELDDGKIITIHCPNTGSMTNCQDVGADVWFSKSDNPNRKYAFTWELVAVKKRGLAGINTLRANSLVREALDAGRIKELQGYASIRSEVGYGVEKSRIDFLLEQPAANLKQPQRCYVEVKNVTLGGKAGVGYFPDAITQRGAKHLRELMEVRKQGHRAVLIFCVQHTQIKEVRPADHIDPMYGKALRQAIENGVEVLAYGVKLTPYEAEVKQRMTVVCPELELEMS